MIENALKHLTRRTLVLLCGVALFGGIAACDDSSGPNNDTYALQTVNGGSLPYTVPDDDNNARIVGGGLTLRSNGSFSLSLAGQVTPEGGVQTEIRITASGTYTVSGDTLTLMITATNNPDLPLTTVSALRSGNEITLVASEDLTLLFRR